MMVQVIAHELLHAFGLLGHVDNSIDSPMNAGTSEHFSRRHQFGLRPSDRRGLIALYGRLQPGLQPDELDADKLGSWSHECSHLMDDFQMENGDSAAFGVVYTNGLPQPWAKGPAPITYLENSTLSGTVTRNGALVGYTPSAVGHAIRSRGCRQRQHGRRDFKLGRAA